MPEITVTGMNEIAYPYVSTWHWHVALYLFVGGLVAGLMIVSALFRLTNRPGVSKAIFISDLAGLPLLAGGMFFLWIDLARRWNAWRFFATFQVTSPMSWGSWILLICMILLFLRLITYLPAPGVVTTKNILVRGWYAGRSVVARWGEWLQRRDRVWSVLSLLFGVALGFYTGVLLNTIPARPLWNSSLLPFLFLASGLASGFAFLALFMAHDFAKRLLPLSIGLAIVELCLILSYLLNLMTGAEAAQRAGNLLLNGTYALGLWGLVILIGLLIPTIIEGLEISQRRLPKPVVQIVPVLTLVGGIALRFVIVYAGLHSYI